MYFYMKGVGIYYVVLRVDFNNYGSIIWNLNKQKKDTFHCLKLEIFLSPFQYV